MTKILAAAWLIARKDFTIEARSREIIATAAFFAVACVLVFSFSLVRDGRAPDGVAAGVLWIGIAFSGTLSLGRLFERERAHDTLRTLLLAPIERPAVYLGKLLAVVMLMSAVGGLLLPFTGVALDAALGLLISIYIRQRTYSALVQVFLILVRFGVMVLLGYGFVQFMEGSLALPDSSAFALMFLFGGWADWGLRFLHLSQFGEIWAIVPYGIFLGLALLLTALAQALLAKLLLSLAIRRAQGRG